MRSLFLILTFANLATAQILSVPAPQLPPLTRLNQVTSTAKEIELGRKLFFDPRLSQNNTISCSTCHNPSTGWSDAQPVAIGILNQRGTRNSPTIINASYSPLMFWDGRTVETITQALLPLSNPIEMGRQSEADVLRKLRLIPGYVAMFAEVYGIDPATGSPITGSRLGQAIASFETTIVSFQAPVDRFMAGETAALTADAQVGFHIFQGGGCMDCHKPPLFTDNRFHNNGMEFAGKVRVTDTGRFVVSRQQVDMRAFKTPTLREIQHTAPYGHAGSFGSLESVVRHYNDGGRHRFYKQIDRFQDRRIRPLDLTETQQEYLVKFLKEGFSSPNYPMIEEPVLP